MWVIKDGWQQMLWKRLMLSFCREVNKPHVVSSNKPCRANSMTGRMNCYQMNKDWAELQWGGKVRWIKIKLCKTTQSFVGEEWQHHRFKMQFRPHRKCLLHWFQYNKTFFYETQHNATFGNFSDGTWLYSASQTVSIVLTAAPLPAMFLLRLLRQSGSFSLRSRSFWMTLKTKPSTCSFTRLLFETSRMSPVLSLSFHIYAIENM